MPAPAIAEPTNQAELNKKLAQLVIDAEPIFGADGRFKTVESQVEALAKLFLGAEKVDLKAVVEQVEKNRSGLEALQKKIRTSKGPIDLDGAENEPFSIHKALRAYSLCLSQGRGASSHKAIFEQLDAAHEFEVLKSVDRARAERKDLVYDEQAIVKLQSVGDDQLGGFFVPDQILPDVIGPVYVRSAFINATGEDGDRTRVSVLEGLFGGRVEIMKFDGGVISFWLGEQDAVTESAAKTGSMFLEPKRLGCLVVLTEAMRKFGAQGFDALLRRDMTRSLAKKIDLAIAYGQGGSNQPTGLAKSTLSIPATNQIGIKVFQAKVTSGVDESDTVDPSTITDWPSHPLGIESLDKMKLGMEEDNIDVDETFSYISSPRLFSRLKNLKAIQFSGGEEHKSPFILGLPVSDAKLRDVIGEFGKSTQIPTTNLPGASIGGATTNADAKHTDVFYGNFGEFLFGRWAGVEFTTDQGLGKHFESGKELMKMVTYVGTGIRQPRALGICPNAKVR